MQKQKGKVPTSVGIIIIVVVAVVLFGGVFAYQHFTKTAGWKTYKNTQYGFEFQYPNDFVVKPAVSNSERISLFYAKKLPMGIDCHYTPSITPEELIAAGQAQNSHNFRFNYSKLNSSAYRVDSFGGYMGGYWDQKDIWISAGKGSVLCSVYEAVEPPTTQEQSGKFIKQNGLFTEQEKVLSEKIISTFKFTK